MFKKLFDGNFQEVLKDCDWMYQDNKPEKGESFKTMDLEVLKKKLEEEYDEWDMRRVSSENNTGRECDELCYLINVALMVLYRVKKEYSKTKKTEVVNSSHN